jgi:hypothetical protein
MACKKLSLIYLAQKTCCNISKLFFYWQIITLIRNLASSSTLVVEVAVVHTSFDSQLILQVDSVDPVSMNFSLNRLVTINSNSVVTSPNQQ